MVEWSIIAKHGLAFFSVWACAVATGWSLLPLARVGIGLAGAPLLGIIYWTLALYLLPFCGGLDVAAIVILLLGAFHLIHGRRKHGRTPVGRRFSSSALILALGSLPYATTVLFHYVPFGMDASMHTTAAALIARIGGLPTNYAPIAPEVTFPAINLGLSTVAAVAIRWGSEPAAAMLACQHLTFTSLILATYLLLRWWISRPSAAVLSVASVWLARASQASLGWGGFPTVMSVAIGVLAVRLLLQHSRRTSPRQSLTTGAAIAAIPLIHGVGGGTWIYCAGIWTVLATIADARSRFETLRGLALAGLCAGVFLVIYRMSGSLDVQQREMDLTRAFVQVNAPRESGWRAWLSAMAYVRKDSGTLIVLAGWLACGVLALIQQWRSSLLLTAAWLALATVVANARWYSLPGSFLLYPDRAIYWSAPLSAVALSLCWRNLSPMLQLTSRPKIAALFLLLASGYFHNQFYQKIVREEFMDRDAYEALVWARDHLQPDKHFVNAPYNTPGSFLPAVAQIGCTGSHNHHFLVQQIHEAHVRRTCTHCFLCNETQNEASALGGKIVFHNGRITIVELKGCSAAGSP